MQDVDGALHLVRVIDPPLGFGPVPLLDHLDELEFDSGHVISDEFGIQFFHGPFVPR